MKEYKILHLHLKRKYWEPIRDGKKPYEYRLRNSYWKKRFDNKQYDLINLYCGYPKKNDDALVLVRKFKNIIKTRITHKEFGGEVDVYAIDVTEGA